jgi:hypothetical protein
MYSRSPCLKKAIRETACRRAEVRTYQTFHVDAKLRQSAFEFQAAAPHITHLRGYFDAGIGRNRLPCLRRFLTVHQNFARHNEGLRFLPRLSQTVIDKPPVEP